MSDVEDARFSTVSLMFAAPLIGYQKSSPDVLHALTMSDIAAREHGQQGTAACGITGIHLYTTRDEQGRCPVSWPPRVRSLPDPMTRCQECYRLTGKPRPRSTFLRHGQEETLHA